MERNESTNIKLITKRKEDFVSLIAIGIFFTIFFFFFTAADIPK